MHGKERALERSPKKAQLPSLLSRAASESGDRLALATREGVYTYAELYACVGAIRGALEQGPGDAAHGHRPLLGDSHRLRQINTLPIRVTTVAACQ